MDTRIRLGLVRKLCVPDRLRRDLLALAKPGPCLYSGSTQVQIGPTFKYDDQRFHKIVFVYIPSPMTFGVLFRRVDAESGRLLTTGFVSDENDPSFRERRIMQ